jgi:hypothetical protein
VPNRAIFKRLIAFIHLIITHPHSPCRESLEDVAHIFAPCMLSATISSEHEEELVADLLEAAVCWHVVPPQLPCERARTLSKDLVFGETLLASETGVKFYIEAPAPGVVQGIGEGS